MRVVELHDGSRLTLRKLEEEYDSSDRVAAIDRLLRAQEEEEFLTGLLYYDASRPNLAESSNLVETPLAELPGERLRPPREALEKVMARYS